ncbi:Ribosome maturation factor RimM [Candidatus Sulfotelmatobacter kueseliae]|uniref:Ribosome maturation factor RimM n=1 Tax=Candidatus Sulfotelmatobacter kueseliae TaxID=2042962 RepID=A0A2U3KH68_9BACT|nr:Ribosome maturation factor RimM [Candidatus Sulfotelmatobacter kueseliae]
MGERVRDRGAPSGAKDNADYAASTDFITLARVLKTQGRHGEVAVEVHSDVPERFAAGMKLLALPPVGSARRGPDRAKEAEPVTENDSRRELEIADLWPHKGLLVLKFRGVDSISDAEVLVGAELQAPGAERAKLELGWTYVSDLVGCTVFDHGREIGCIEDVQFGAGEAPLLIVADGAGKKFDVPFVEAYLESVEAARRQVHMQLPEGMLEVNAPVTAEEKQEQEAGRGRSRKNKK